jgi:hypothetical protein
MVIVMTISRNRLKGIKEPGSIVYSMYGRFKYLAKKVKLAYDI